MAKRSVYFITNRNLKREGGRPTFGVTFNPNASSELRYGRAEVDENGGEFTVGDIEVYPERRTSEGYVVKGSTGFLTDLHALMFDGAGDSIIFVHGFNTDFADALRSGARLARGLERHGARLNLVVFSWPSDGEKIPFHSYFRDREDARASGPALGRAFIRAREFLEALPPEKACKRNLHLVAHSMGAYVVRNALQYVIGRGTENLVRIFNQVVLAAPDEDDDAFEHPHKLQLLSRLGRRVTCYFSKRDIALGLSDKTKSNPDRLGSDGARLKDMLPAKVAMIDCQDFSGSGAPPVPGDTNHHGYFERSERIQRDLSQILSGVDDEQIEGRIFVPERKCYRVAP